MKILACDVAKASLVHFDGVSVAQTDNTPKAIQKLLDAHPEHLVVCEPTSRYHQPLVDAADRLGHQVILVNPREARKYKDSISFRAKTDPLDARYLYEFVLRNRDLLRVYEPVTPALTKLRELIGQRQAAVSARTALTQAFGGELTKVQKEAIDALNNVVREMDQAMEEIAKQFSSYARFRQIPGVGPLAGCVLVYALESRAFADSAALVAFLGLDVRIRQSGKYRGMQKVSKRGDPLLRFILCFAGRGLLHSKLGLEKREQLTAKRRQFPERMVIAARKILRVAFHLFKTQQDFDPQKWSWALT
jgi:transposase